MIPYLSGVLDAITTYVLLRRAMVQTVNKKWNSGFASIFLMFISFFCISLPVSDLFILLGNKIGDPVTSSGRVSLVLKYLFDKIENKYKFDLEQKINVSVVSAWVTDNLEGFSGCTFNIFTAIGIM
jgi:hypothetical protein